MRHKERYFFIAFHWSNSTQSGFGNVVFNKIYDALFCEITMVNKIQRSIRKTYPELGNVDISVIITNFIQLSKKEYQAYKQSEDYPLTE